MPFRASFVAGQRRLFATIESRTNKNVGNYEKKSIKNQIRETEPFFEVPYNSYYDNHIKLGNYGGVGMMNISGTAEAEIDKMSIGTYGGVGQLTVKETENVRIRDLSVGGELNLSDPLLQAPSNGGGIGRVYLESGAMAVEEFFMGGGGLGVMDMVGGELNTELVLIGQGGGNAIFTQYGGVHNSALVMGVGVNLTQLEAMAIHGVAPKIPDYKDPKSDISVYHQHGGTVNGVFVGAGVLANGVWSIGAPVPINEETGTYADPYVDFYDEYGIPEGLLTVAIPETIETPKVNALAMLGGAQGVGQINLFSGEVNVLGTAMGLLGGGAEINVLGGVYGKPVNGETGFMDVMDSINNLAIAEDAGSVLTIMGLAAGEGYLNVAGTGEYNALVNIFGILDGKGTATVGPGGTFNSTLGLFGVLGEGTLNVDGGNAEFKEFTLTLPEMIYDEANDEYKDMNITVDGIIGAGIGGLGIDTSKLIGPAVKALFGGDVESLMSLKAEITTSPSPGIINVSDGSLTTDYMLLGGLGAEGTMNQTGGNFTANKDVYLAGTVGMPAFGDLADNLLYSLFGQEYKDGYFVITYFDENDDEIPIPRDPNGNLIGSDGQIMVPDADGYYNDPVYGGFYDQEFPVITYPKDLGPTKAEWNVAGGEAVVGGDVKMGVYFTLAEGTMDMFNDPDNLPTEINAMNLVEVQDPETLNPDNPRAEMSSKLNILDGKLRVEGDISVYSDAEAEINVFGGKGKLQAGSLNTGKFIDENGNEKSNGNKVDLNFHIGDDGISTIVVDGEADLSGDNTVGMWGGFVNTTQTEFDVVTAGTLTQGNNFNFTDNTPFDLQTSYIDDNGSTTIRLSWNEQLLESAVNWDLTGIHYFDENATQVVLRLESETIRDEGLVVSFNGLTDELAPLLAAYLNEGLADTGLRFQTYNANSLTLSGDYFLDNLYTYFAFNLDPFNTTYSGLGADISLHDIMVPEPSSWVIMLLGTSGVLWMRRRRKTHDSGMA